MFELTKQPIDPNPLRQKLLVERCGAFVSFEGWVRNHHDGKSVKKLYYQVYPELALNSGKQIIQDALAEFAIDHAVCVHRTGQLEIGDLAVWVGVSIAHRDAAFDACRYIIDTVKQDVAIWKREYYVDSADEQSQWLENSL
ncbi:MAG: molybdenum cofactor biosynthesis protein MoaE [Candidatus Saccharibacteria bacterium]|nr:molybdenum cofactor biosynthesis protein MoaE [Moraxellaceae bacterium]